MQQESSETKKVDYRLLRRLIGFLKPYKPHIGGAVVLTLVSSALGPLRPYLTRIAVDDHIVKGDFPGLLMFVGIIVGLLFLQGALQYGLSLLMTWVGQRVLLDIRNTLFRHVERLALRFYDTTPVGRIVTRVTSDVEVLNELFSSGVVLMISDVMVIVWILYFMWSTSPQLTMMTIIILPFLLIASFIFRGKVRKVYNLIRRQVARMNSFMNEFVTGIGVVQLFRQEERMERQFAEINKEHRELQDRSVFYHATFFPVVEFLSAVALSIIVWYAAGNILSGAMTIGMLIAFTQFTEMFFRPVRDLTEKYNTLQSSVVASERIFSLLDTDMTVPDAPNAAPFTELEGAIEFRDVHFSYDGTTPVLKGVSFTVNKGETVALVGATGAGKSSIINLLSRFYEFQGGDILVDGKSIRDVRQHDLRARIAVVLQDVFLFSRSVEENITLGREEITLDDVVNAAVSLGADPFIRRLPNGYQTNVRERGAVLSVGQKQLISFCRAMVTDPDILILDEATSNIDTETEQLIERSITTMLQGRTSIVIAHRLSTIQRADRIVVLHHGEVAEVGTHQELLAHGGLYAKLHALQFA
ncbi:MAG: ABC transporter ATP-binding protein [Ignavibacteria bacterium]|nr:ABC transporter ATP-binding protein [Ignavibacteria bacterium]MBP7093130.1 ABC transporter ATP-binding protein [Candidatus Kapabacteria bacterium]MBK6760529.1 ABC transporter ATP-binding protein [Ignavibacteria bacterium]MBK7032487.1 ABC transporter ATP-binding protein [Ignavibacteria bacterium]MBK7186030.1 ABC transporter ATP-binding protein [Ignavibacteria bacterium]